VNLAFPDFAGLREQYTGCASSICFLLDLASPLDAERGNGSSLRCRLCTGESALRVTLLQWYQDPAGNEFGPDCRLGLGVCAQCAENHAPGLLAAQREKTHARVGERRSNPARLRLAHYRIRAALPALLQALGYDEAVAAEAAVASDPYDS